MNIYIRYVCACCHSQYIADTKTNLECWKHILTAILQPKENSLEDKELVEKIAHGQSCYGRKFL